jgi:hypothetical protein
MEGRWIMRHDMRKTSRQKSARSDVNAQAWNTNTMFINQSFRPLL